ncbi:MAG: hypothetical protein IB617_03585 [Candidatus Nealsonbacteria bacterium]|nr:MAG: hypothetical protein IB617_03585 [Candidatus Nealsonbacteria bacterium]
MKIIDNSKAIILGEKVRFKKNATLIDEKIKVNRDYIVKQVETQTLNFRKRGIRKINQIIELQELPGRWFSVDWLDLVESEEIPIRGINLVSFEEYKKLGGKLAREEHKRLKRISSPQEEYREAFRVAGDVGCGYPPHPEMELLARVCMLKSNLSSLDKMCEMLLLQGKK